MSRKTALERAPRHVNVMIFHNTNNDWLKAQDFCWEKAIRNETGKIRDILRKVLVCHS